MRHPILTRALVVVLAWSLPALAEPLPKAQKAPEGSEFIDMPTTPGAAAAPGTAAAPAPEPVDEKVAPGYVPGYRRSISLALSPYAPQGSTALPGSLTPVLGAPAPSQSWRFSFGGYLQTAVRMSMGERDHAYANQQKVTLHGDPVVAGGAWGWFDHTNTVVGPWTQLNFIYGNESVQATAILGAWNTGEAVEAAQSYMPQAQQWFTDAFLTYRPPIYDPLAFEVKIGSYRDSYGAMQEYSNGAYSVPLIADITGIGTTVSALVPFEYDLDLRLQVGLKGELNKPPRYLVQDRYNESARSIEGSTLAAHGHASLGYLDIVVPTLHYVYSWSQDDLGDPVDDPNTPADESRSRRDGSLTVLGADVRVKGGRFGYFYFGAARSEGKDATSISDLVKVLGTGSGKEFMEHFWGYDSNGSGKVLFVGGQYMVSLGTLLRYPMEFWGEGPDLFVNVFGIYGQASSPVAEFDGQTMAKYGAELTYSCLPWLALSGRFDHVTPNLDDSTTSFAVFSPKLVFRTDWQAREALTVQYAHYFLGSNVRVRGDNQLSTPSGRPDRDLLAIYATLSWW
jgi:hypothetical protein